MGGRRTDKYSMTEQINDVYSLDPEIEQTIIACMFSDRAFLLQCRDLINPKYFEAQHRRLLVQIIFDYFDEYSNSPCEAIIRQEIIDRAPKTNLPQGYFLTEFNTIVRDCLPNLSIRDYLLDRVEDFAKKQALKTSVMEVVALHKSDDPAKWDKIQESMKKPFLISRQKDLGLDYFNTLEERFARMLQKQESKDFFPTGFDPFDDAIGGGIGRGELAAYLAGSGVGKSVALVQTALHNVNSGRRVLYFSLEMDQDKVATRFDSMLSNYPINDLLPNALQVIDIIKEQPIFDKNPEFGSKRLIVKQFPAGTADINTLRAFTSQLKMAWGFQPDMVVLDYVGELKDVPGLKTHESRQRACRDFRAWAIEDQFGAFTALQPNRGATDFADDGGVIDESFLADSFGQVRVLDLLISISRSRKEKLAGLAKMHSVKVRNGKGGITYKVFQNPNTLRFTGITDEEYNQRRDEIKMQDLNINVAAVPKKDKKKFDPNGGNL